MTIAIKTLKHTNYYWVDGARVQFYAEAVKESFFTIAVGRFVWPDGKEVIAKAKPITKEVVISEPLTFELRFEGGNWRAPLRESI